MKWYFRFIIKDGKIVDELDITENIVEHKCWETLLTSYEGRYFRESPNLGKIYYAEVDENDL
jgi:hypothetical protein